MLVSQNIQQSINKNYVLSFWNPSTVSRYEKKIERLERMIKIGEEDFKALSKANNRLEKKNKKLV